MAELLESKVCSKCGVEKQLSEFGYRKETGKYRNQCKQCVKDAGIERSKKKAEDGLPDGRVCSKCGKYKSKEHFALHKGSLRSYCKECDHSKYYLPNVDKYKIRYEETKDANREHKSLVSAQYYQRNKEALCKKFRDNYPQVKEHKLAQAAKYYRENKNKFLVYAIKAKLKRDDPILGLTIKQREKKYREGNLVSCAIATQNHRAFKM